MPNGGDYPFCPGCKFFEKPDGKEHCMKNDLVLPSTGGEILCADWEDREHGTRVPFSHLKRNILYSHNFYSRQSPEPLFPFEKLNRLINLINVGLREDFELGWVLCPFEGDYRYFPEPGQSLSMKIQGTEAVLEVLQGERRFRAIKMESDGFVSTAGWVKENNRILYNPGSPKALFDWFNEFFDAEAAEGRPVGFRKEIKRLKSFGVLVEIDSNGGVYSLRPNILLYGEFGRGPYKREKRGVVFNQVQFLTKFFKVMMGTRKGRIMLVKGFPKMLWQWVGWKYNNLKRSLRK